MSNAEKPKTPTLDYLRRQPRTSGVSTPADRCVDEHDAIDAWWKEQLAAKDAEIARLSRPRVAPSHKGVTYRDGMWWDADDEGYELASKCIADNSPQCHVAGSKQELLTDDDHAALLALKTEAERVSTLEGVVQEALWALAQGVREAIREDSGSRVEKLVNVADEKLRAAFPQFDDAPRVMPDREAVARRIYDAMVWAASKGAQGSTIPLWVEGGNSFAQYEARGAADTILSLFGDAREQA